jgi:hypothetical protein
VSDVWRKLLASTVICYVVGFLALFIVSVLSFSLENTLELLFWDWVFARTWAEFLSLAPVAQAWAALLTYAWAIPMARTETGPVSFTVFTGSIALVLVFGLIFAVAYLVWQPQARARVNEIEYTSTLADALLISAEEAELRQDYSAAEIDLSQYLTLVGEDPEMQSRLNQIRNQIDLDRPSTEEDERGASGVPERASAESLIDRAEAARAREDYSTAHYMATLALSVDAGNETAARLAAESLDRLESLAADIEEEAALELFRSKQRAKRLINQAQPIEAYYLLVSLDQTYPRDIDVDRYLTIASDLVQDQAVFRDEVEQALVRPGVVDIVFVNRSDSERTELIAIGKLVQTASGIYAQQVEAIEFTSSGQTTYQVTSPYAKLVDGHFVFTIVDRGPQERIVQPQVTVGQATRRNPGLLELTPQPGELSLIAELSRNPQAATLASLLDGPDLLEQYGVLTTPLRVELLLRFVAPVTFVAFTIFAMGLGWRFRSKYIHMPPVPTLIVVPAAALLLLPFYQMVLYLQRVVFAAVLLSAGFVLALILVIAVQALILLFVLFYTGLAARR